MTALFSRKTTRRDPERPANASSTNENATNASPASNTPATGTAPGQTPIEGGVVTDGTQGAAGGSPSTNLVPLPDLPTAGLADVRERDVANAPLLTVENAVLQALQDNPTPKQARAALSAALARIGIVRAGARPTGNANLSSNYQRTSGSSSRGGSGGVDPGDGTGSGPNNNGSGNSSRSEQLSLGFSIPITTGGRVKASRRAAESNARAALANAQQTEQEIAAQTILAYISILQTQELLEVAQSNLDTTRERRRIAGVRFDAGAAARLEVLRADSDLASAAQNRIAAANSLAQSRAALNILLARAPEAPVRVERITSLVLPTSARFPLAAQATAIATGATAPTSPDLRAVAETALPSLEASREQINAAQFGVDAQRAQRRPSISASISGLLRNPAEFVGRTVLGAGLSLAQTLFSGGRISSQVAEARAQVEQTRFNLVGQRLQVANAIEGSLLTLDSSTKRLASADVAVLSAQEALRAAQLSYTAGAGTQLEVIDAQNALVAVQTDAVNARYAVASAQVQLAAATAVTQGGSATGRSGLGSSAGTGQSSTFSASGANQSGGQFGNGNTLGNGGIGGVGGGSSSGLGGINTGGVGTGNRGGL
jgi:outer membrane protein TolC